MRKLVTIIITTTILFIGCKDSDRDNDTTINSCEDYATAQSYAYNIFKVVHQAALSSKGIATNHLSDTTTLFGCDTLIVDTTSSPKTITIQFNGACNNQTGSIIAAFTNKYDNLGSSVAITLNNYSYNGYPITGTIGYSFNGIINNEANYNINFSNINIKNAKERILNWSANQTIKIANGETTATTNDDTYLINGSSTGRAFAGNDFTTLLNSDLTLLGNCNWISSGTATVSPENKQPRVLDFGSGCDNKATAKIYNLSYEVVIP